MTVIKTNSYHNFAQCPVCYQWYVYGEKHECPKLEWTITVDSTQEKLDKIINLLTEIKDKIK